VAWVGNAGAATFPATSTQTFMAAVASANSSPGDNTIDVAAGVYSPPQTVELTNKTGTLTIVGPAPSASVQGSLAHFTGGALVTPMPGASVFEVDAGVTASFENIDITTAGSAGNGVIDDNGTVSIVQSTITGAGPGLTIEPNSTGSMLNSTISDGLDFGIIDDGTLTLTNSTIARNPNGGIDNVNGVLNLVNSIVATNGSPDCTGPANSSDHSLDGDGTCGVGALSGKNPQLAKINVHGGTTPTDVPLAGSPAIKAGDPAACPAVDERNAPRPSVAGSPCDIGAVETYYGIAPVLTNADVKIGSPSASGTVATYTPTWRAGSPVTGVTCTPPSGSTFAPGPTTVTCTGTDSTFGATGSGTFKVTDVEASPPVITTSGDETVVATDETGAIVTFTASASDPTDGSDPATCSPASGTRFAIGATTVTCTATDSGSLTGTATLTITVTEPVVLPAPTIHVPADITVDATSPAGASVPYTVTAADPAGGSDPVSCSPGSGSTFAIATTTVTCSATSTGKVSGTNEFTVTVEPGPPPVIGVPSDMSLAATSPGGAQVTYTASATDARDGTVPVICEPASGSTFAIATTTVNCAATDSIGNTATASFVVTVAESSPPVIVVPADITAAATGPSGAKVSFPVTATDPVDGALVSACAPASGSTFPIGTTTVSCSATDRAGNGAAASFTVTVPPPSGPVITVPAYRVLGALNSQGDPVTYSVSATDQIDNTDPVTCTPASGATFRIGTTSVACTATDSGGRTATASFDVTVLPPAAPATAAAPIAHAAVEGSDVVVSLRLAKAGRLVLRATFKRVVSGRSTVITFATFSGDVKAGTRSVRLKPGKAALGVLSGVAASSRTELTLTAKLTPKTGRPLSNRTTTKIAGLKPRAGSAGRKITRAAELRVILGRGSAR
jgi:hypothetical protein